MMANDLPQGWRYESQQTETDQPSTGLPSGWRFENQASPQQPEEESYSQATLRHGARSGARAVESVVGLPHSSAELGESVVGLLPESLKGGKGKIPEGKLSREELENIYEPERSATDIFTNIKSVLPSSESVREKLSQTAPKGYLEPKNEAEKFADDIISDFTPLLIPTGGVGKGIVGAAKHVGRALGIAGTSNAASYLAKNLGAGEKGQAVVKLGTALLTSLGMSPSLRKKATALYQSAKQDIKPG
jgi:hypothetical protein